MTSEQRNRAADIDCSAVGIAVRAARKPKIPRWTIDGVKATRPRPKLCEACGKREKHLNQWGEPRELCFDHCHETHKFRGWLCQNCNLSLGLLGTDITTVRKLANYLETYDSREQEIAEDVLN